MIYGFLAGLTITVIVFILLFSLNNEKFTFDLLINFHRDLPLLYFIDFLPPAGIILAYFLSIKHNRIILQIDERIQRETLNNDFIKSAVQNLTQGNLNAQLVLKDIDQEITSSLVNLQSRLKENREIELNTREEDNKRNWTSQGLAEFGDVLRTYSSDRENLGYAVISKLVRYLDINQGGFFIIQEQDGKRFLEMIACHAYDRNKFPDKRIGWGEGLIGAVAIEEKSYYTDKIPDGYLSITSGLGRANPRHLLIVPLVLNNEVFGVFELASFKKIEDYFIQFVERVAENTATTLNILNSNLRTEQLLKETQEQAAQLTIQEEKVRQKIIELQQTQAEAARQSEQFVSFTNTVNHTLIRAEYETDGRLIYVNTRFLKKLGYSGNREVEGKHISMFIHESDREEFDSIWKRLSRGGAHYEGYMRHVTKMGLELWTMATYTCVRNDDNSIKNILFLALDSSIQKAERLQLDGQIRAINKLSPKAEFSPDGRLLLFNDLFQLSFKYSPEEMEEKRIFDFIIHSDLERFNEIWEQVVLGNAYEGQIRMYGKSREEIWFRSILTAITDMQGEVERILFQAFNITKEKELEQFMRNQKEMLKETEEQLRLRSLDLNKKIDDMEQSWHIEKTALKKESSTYADILKHQPLPTIGVNNQGFVTIYNRAAEKYFRTSGKKVINNRIDVLLNGPQNDPVVKAFIDPGKTTIEATMKKVSLSISDHTEKEATISIIQTESGSEMIYTMIISPGGW
jgi:PAS domain S-box-containing protein